MSNQNYPSAVRSATFIGDDNRKVPGNRGCKAVLNVTAVPGIDTVQLTIEGRDALSGVYYLIAFVSGGAARSAAGTDVLTVLPGVTPVANVAFADALPDVYRVRVIHSGVGSFTYSLSVTELA